MQRIGQGVMPRIAWAALVGLLAPLCGAESDARPVLALDTDATQGESGVADVWSYVDGNADGVVQTAQGGETGSDAETTGADAGGVGGKVNFSTQISLDELYRVVETLPERQEVRMSLRECIAIALLANPDILVTSFEPLKYDAELLQARGEFDPQFLFSGSYSKSDAAPSAQTTSFLGGFGGSSGLSSLTGGTGNQSTGWPVIDRFLRAGTQGVAQGIETPLAGILGDYVGRLGDTGGGRVAQLPAFMFLQNLAQFSQMGGQLVRGGIQNYGRQFPIVNFINPPEPLAQSIESERQNFQTGVQGKLHWGTTYDLKLDLGVEESTFNDFQQEWSGGLTLSLSQPLLRGRGKSANLARVRRAKNSRLSGEHQLEQQFMNSLAEVVKAYWDLVGAHEELRVREESLTNAERLLHINERRLAIGHGAAIDVVQAKAGVAARLSDFVSARSQIGDAEDRLKQLLDMRDEDVLVPAKIVPVDRPKPAEVELDEPTSVQRALENRPEIAMAEIDIDSAEIERKRAANDMLPQLDLAGSYNRGGRGPDARDVFRGIEFESDSVWTASLEGSIPITNRVGRGAYHGALMSKRQARQRLQQHKLDIATNVRMAMRGVGTSRTLVESNRQTVALQQTNVEAETKRLQLGVTTSYDVLKIQEDLTTAQSQEVQAQVNFEKAIVDLQLAEGLVLDEYGVDFEPPEPERPVEFLRSIVPPGVRDN